MSRKRPRPASFGFSDADLAVEHDLGGLTLPNWTSKATEADAPAGPTLVAASISSAPAPGSEASLPDPPPVSKRRKASHLNLPALLIEEDEDASEVFLRQLYIGGEAAVGSIDRLHITHVVRLARVALDDAAARRNYSALFKTADEEDEEEELVGEKVLQILTADDCDAVISAGALVAFVAAALAGGGCVLIHCREGISRSSAATLLFLVARKPKGSRDGSSDGGGRNGLTFEDPDLDVDTPAWRRSYPLASALAFLKHRRPCVLPNAAMLGKAVVLEQFVQHRITLDFSSYAADPRRFMQEAVPVREELQRVWTGGPLRL